MEYCYKQCAHIFNENEISQEAALVFVWDIEGSSRLLDNLDNIKFYVKFYNTISKCIHIIANGGNPYWDKNEGRYTALPKPIHSEFTGDGSVCVFLEKDLSVVPPLILPNRIRNLVVNFKKVIAKCSNEMPGIDFPKNVRFGIAPGTISILTYNSGKRKKYQIAAKCFNLASKLQLLCKDYGLRFMASANIPGITKLDLKKSHYKIITVTPPSMSTQRVFIHEGEFIKIRDCLQKKNIHVIDG